MTLGYYGPIGNDPSQSGYVSQPLACCNCQQDLMGLHEGHRCWNCGIPVGRTTQPGVLRFAPIAWLSTVRHGLLFEAWAIIIGISAILAMMGVAFVWALDVARSGGPEVDERTFLVGGAVLVFLFLLALTYGIWRITTPEPQPGASRHGRRTVSLARWSAIAALGFSVVALTSMAMGLDERNAFAAALLECINNLAHAVVFLTLTLTMAEYASHIPNREFAQRTRTLARSGAIGSAILALLGLLTAATVGDPFASDSVGRRGSGMAAVGCFSGIAAIFVLVCYIMFLVTLFQLAGHFRQAIRYAESIMAQPMGVRPMAAQPIDPSAYGTYPNEPQAPTPPMY